MDRLKLAAVTAAALAFACPATAQESSYTPGNYWTVSMIDIAPGQDENYADYLASQYKRNQDHAKSKGWITDYHVLANVNARDGEPDLYLITEFKEMPSRAESLRRDKEYEAFMKKDARVLSAESGTRITIRTPKGSMLLQELVLKGR